MAGSRRSGGRQGAHQFMPHDRTRHHLGVLYADGAPPPIMNSGGADFDARRRLTTDDGAGQRVGRSTGAAVRRRLHASGDQPLANSRHTVRAANEYC